MSIPQHVKSFIDGHHVGYEVIHHHRDYTAQEAAADTHTPGKNFAKTVVLYVDNDYCMVVLPAIYEIDMEKLRTALHAKYVSLAMEEELEQVCYGSEIGAMPPLGTMYNMPVYVDRRLAEDDIITFNAGTHEDAIRMTYADFEELVRPKVIDFAGNHV